VPDAGLPAIVGELFPFAVSTVSPDAIGSSALKHPNSIGPASIAKNMFRIHFPQIREAGYMPKLLYSKSLSEKDVLRPIRRDDESGQEMT
jgi:hypothetical protein